MTLALTPELERRLACEVERAGKPADEYALEPLDKQLPAPPPNEGLITVLRSLREEGDAQEQRETFEALKNGLDETRAANGERIVFP